MLNILPKVSSQTSLLAINLMKIEIYIFQTVTWSHVGHLIKGSCLGASNTKSASCVLWFRYIFCRWRYILLVTWSNKTTPSFIFMGESSSQHVTTLKCFVTIGILIVKRKLTSSKTWTLQICTATEKLSWLDNHYARKNVTNTKMVYFEKCPKIK